MTVQRERNGRKVKQHVAIVGGLAVLLSSGALMQGSPQETKTKEKEQQVLTTQNKFYLQHQSSESRGARAPQAVDRQADREAERDCGDGEGLRIPVHSIDCLNRGVGRLGGG